MEAADLIMSLVTLALILLFMFNPLFRKVLKSFQGDEEKAERGEDRMYESADSRRVVMNLTDLTEAQNGKKIVIREPEIPATVMTQRRAVRREDYAGKIRKKSDLKRAYVWKEILGSPRALKPFGKDELF